MQGLFLNGVLPVLIPVSTKGDGQSTTQCIFQLPKYKRKLGDQNVVCELIAVIKSSPLIKYN